MQLKPNHQQVVEIERASLRRTGLGIIRGVGREWILVQVVDDLRVDGWECVRRRDIQRLTRTIHTRFAERVLKGEGELDTGTLPEVQLDDTASLLKSLRDLPMLALECEATGDFSLGQLLRVGTRTVAVHAIDPGGAWERTATRLPLADLTRVQFGDHYSTMFHRYGEP